MDLLPGKTIWIDLKTAFINIDELLLYLKKRDFTGYFDFRFLKQHSAIFLLEGDVVNGIEESEKERKGGQYTVKEILQRSRQDKNGTITVSELPTSTVALLSEEFCCRVEILHKDLSSDFSNLVQFLAKLKHKRFSGYIELYYFNDDNKQAIVFLREGKIKAILKQELLANLKEETSAELKFIKSFVEGAQRTGITYTAFARC